MSGTELTNNPWSMTRSHIRVLLRDIVTEASIGLHPWEQHPERLTRLVVNVEMFAPLAQKGPAHPAGAFIDYDPIRNALRSWPTRPHTPLLETLVYEVVELCFVDPRVEACRVSVVKPDIFNEVAAAGVEIVMTKADFTSR